MSALHHLETKIRTALGLGDCWTVTLIQLLQWLGEDYAITGDGFVIITNPHLLAGTQLDLSKPLSDQNEAVIEFLLNIK